MLDGASAPPADAFRKETASFGSQWESADTYRLDQDEPPGARKTSLFSSVLGDGGYGENMLSIAVAGLFILLSLSDACEDEDDLNTHSSSGFVYTSGGSGGYTSSGGKSSRIGSTGSRWGSGGGFGFGK
jgi:hypothetical protein